MPRILRPNCKGMDAVRMTRIMELIPTENENIVRSAACKAGGHTANVRFIKDIDTGESSLFYCML